MSDVVGDMKKLVVGLKPAGKTTPLKTLLEKLRDKNLDKTELERYAARRNEELEEILRFLLDCDWEVKYGDKRIEFPEDLIGADLFRYKIEKVLNNG